MRTAAIAASVVSLLLFGCATAGRQDADATIRANASQFANAFNRADWQAVSAFYTDDAVVLAPHTDLARGPAAIHQVFASFAPLKPQMTLTTDRVVQSGNVAYEYGTYTMRMTGAPNDRGKYLTVWQRMPSGEWKISADMYNTSLPHTEPRPASVSPETLAEVKQLLGFGLTLNRIAEKLIDLQATNPKEYGNVERRVAESVNRIRQMLALGPGCPEGTCDEYGICVPCSVLRLAGSMSRVESELILLYGRDPRRYDNVKSGIARELATMATLTGLSSVDCGMGGCLEFGICVPCDVLSLKE